MSPPWTVRARTRSSHELVVTFIPLEFLVINTLLPPAEVRARLAAAVDPEPRGGTREELRPLRGTVGLATFALRRGMPSPGALLPEFRGRIEPRAGGARLTGMVSLDPLPVLALAVAAVVAFAVGAKALAGVFMGELVEPLLLAPLGAVVLAWVLAVRNVTSEARRLRRLVGVLLEGSVGGGLPRQNGAT